MADNNEINIGRDASKNVIVSGKGNIIIVQQSIPKEDETLPSVGKNPYKGLSAFHEQDAEHFFGREKLIKHLWETYRRLCENESDTHFLAILGPSGSGKSSLARAGLIPELARNPLPAMKNARVAVFTPGTKPIESLSNLLARIAFNDTVPVGKALEFEELIRSRTDGFRRIVYALPDIADSRLVILVDQFEEIFSLCEDKNEQKKFIENLIYAAKDKAVYVSIIITLRSDFLAQTQSYPELSHVIAENSVIVPAMNVEELCLAIVEPAKKMGYKLDTATTDLLIEQTQGYEGTLPLLEFALTTIWEGIKQGIEPVKSLRDIGGIGGALAGEAQKIYAALSEKERHITRRIFLALIQLGEGTKDTRRRMLVSEMVAYGENFEQVHKVLRKFSSPSARLITLSADLKNREISEITHESLFEHWDTLKSWLEKYRDDIRLSRRISDAATFWNENNCNKGALWGEEPNLSLLKKYYNTYISDMTPIQIAFYKASLRKEWSVKIWRMIFALTLVILTLISVFFAFRERNAIKHKELAMKAAKMITYEFVGELSDTHNSHSLPESILYKNIEILKEIYSLNIMDKENPDTLKSMNNLAFLYFKIGRYQEAEPLYKETLQLRVKIWGNDHPDTLKSMNNLAGLYSSQGRYAEAEMLFKQTLQLREKALGKEHPDMLNAINNLALLYYKQRRYREAEPLFIWTLQLREKVLGKEHPDTLTSINNLAELFRSQGRYGEAEPLFNKALQLREIVLGKEHSDTMMSINNLAELYQYQGLYNKAEPLYKAALQLREKVLGKEHPDTSVSINNLAGLYRSQGRYREAEPLFKEALQLREKVLGKEHPNTLATQLGYISLMVSMEKTKSAFQQLKSMEQQLFSRSFKELYSTSEDRIRRLYLQNNSNFQDTVFSFALKYPETEYQRYAANVMLRWKAVYAEEYSYQYRMLNLNNDSGIKQLREKLAKLRSDFSSQIYHPKPDVDTSVLWNEINASEKIIREKANLSKPNLQASDADISQLTSKLLKESSLIEFRVYRQVDFKTGESGKPHLAAYLLLSDTPQQILFEDMGEVESLNKHLEAKEKVELSYQALFGKFDKHIRNLKKIYIAPDGFLNLIPFHTLRLSDGKYWTERQQINILQTGRDLLSPPSANSSKLFVAVGGVDYGDMWAASELGKGLKYLENSLFEAKAIEDMFKENYPDGKTLVLQGKDATEAALRNLAQAPKILHISTHGFNLETPQKKAKEWSEEEPLLLSGLALAGANRELKGMTDDKGDDGVLYSIEVLSMNLQGTELVSLSACDTGKGVMDYSEGVYGLVRAFRTAGAQNVLMTLLPVSDRSSRVFMEKFYDIYLSSEGKLAPSEALHQTRLHFINHPNMEYRKPEIWGPYVLVGR